ncbi:Translocation protein sec66 [Sphaceloma murrayae]|uniref:Translocation protein sec66 n=1 Tax=Sphaceloma murrayae TaxID=2082308 RepID=A0A2K1QZB4_9PEZI|nr:Translocation protein sec66 [Sphaceloma murrayae]
MVNWIGLLIPVAYLTVLLGSLGTFSYLYRKRKAAKSASLAPWFPSHLQRNIYLSLLHIDPADPSSAPAGSEKTLSKVPESIIKAALMRRAVEDIHRIIQVRNAKPALQSLLQRGSVGEELWQRFLRAEQEIEEEVKDVVEEANALAPNWGQVIFQSANEIANNQLAKARMEELQAKVEDEREWWDARKKGIQEGFMKELDEEKAGTPVAKPAVKSSSDDDAVLVEAGGPAGTQGSGGSIKGKKKSKK